MVRLSNEAQAVVFVTQKKKAPSSALTASHINKTDNKKADH